jgi:hypothetical protein
VADERQPPGEPAKEPESGPDQRPVEETGPPLRAKPVPLVHDLRRSLELSDASWTVDERLNDHDELPRYLLGGDLGDRIPAAEVPPIDFEEISRQLPANPYLIARRLELGLVHPDLEELARDIAQEPPDEELQLQ